MNTLPFDIPKFAGRIASDAKYQARQLVSKQGKHCDTCKLILSPKSFVRGHTTCRSCERRAEAVIPSCHPMLLVKW